MSKKLIGIVILVTIIFGIFGLAGCDNTNIADYKVTKSIELQDYADAKGQNNYDESGWAAICKAVTDGKLAIEMATSKPDIDTVVTVAKAEIDQVEMDEVEGMFYSLDYAFDNGWLTTEQLQSIAYYYYEECIAHDHSECESFTPISKNPSTLSIGTQTAIKQTYLRELQKRAENATLDNIQIANYLGTYRDCIIVGVTDNCFLYDYLFEPEHTIGGVLLLSYCANFTQVWKVK